MTQADLPLILEPDQLERHLGQEDLLIVDLSDRTTHAMYHVPGAVHLEYSRIVAARPPALGLLPDDQQLNDVFSAIGLTPDAHLVAYDDGGNGKGARLLWTLDVVGHPRFSLLNGGLHAWLNEGHPLEEGLDPPQQRAYRVAGHKDVIADKAYVLAHLGDPDVVFLDTRTPAEFSGVDKRAARAGHIPGAINMEWTLATDRTRQLRLKREAELREMLEKLRVTPDKQVIVYCQTHHRSAHTYVALKALGFPQLKGYAGSWSEWGNDPELPIEN